jgi:hypothetical protein
MEMVKNRIIKNLLIDISLMPCLFVGMLLCERLLYVFVLRPLGIPTAQADSEHHVKFILEIVLGLPTVLAIAWADIYRYLTVVPSR